MSESWLESDHNKFFSRFSPIGQSDTVNQLPDRDWLLNPNYDVVKKLLAEPKLCVVCNTLTLEHTTYKWS